MKILNKNIKIIISMKIYKWIIPNFTQIMKKKLLKIKINN